MASVQNLPDLNPCCSSPNEARSFILFVIIFVVNFKVVQSKFIPL